MKLCPVCGAQIEGDGWRCSSCGNDPPTEGGLTLLAPEFAADQAGYDPVWFDRLVEVEDRNWWFRSRNALILGALRRTFPGARSVLEIGCGTGYVVGALSATGYRVTGSELFPSGIAHARRRTPQAEFVQLDARALPYAGAFDVVAAFDVLEHIEEDQLVLNEMARAAAPGGGVIVTVPQHAWLWSRADDHAHHERRYSRRDLLGKFRTAGLEPQLVTSFVSLALPAMYIARLRERHTHDYDPMAEFMIPRWMNLGLERLAAAERSLILAGVSLPLGGSLLVAARRT